MKFSHALLFPKPETPEADSATQKLTEKLTGLGLECHVIHDLSAPLPTTPEENTLAIVLGGDGTFLLTAQALYGKNIPLTGVNLGHLGFLAEASANNLLEHLDNLLNSAGHTETRPYFRANLTLSDGTQASAPFVNDAVLHRKSSGKMVNFTLHAKHKLMTTTRADGLIISTPTGSTAYNLSTGGPIMHPETDALVLAPICPHALSFRPVVLPPCDVRITLEDSPATLTLDGQPWHDITPGAEVTITKAPHHFTILHTQERNFFHTLRQKLGWDS